jgi:hypothetical protein
VTFLRRADMIELHTVEVRDIESSYAETFAAGQLKVSPELVRRAADATGGQPLLVQLVGHFLWRAVENNPGALDEKTFVDTIAEAHRCNAELIQRRSRDHLTPGLDP